MLDTVLEIAPDWTGGIDGLVDTANAWLPRLLPPDRAARPKDEVNARLVRHYTTIGLLPLPMREGREARYERRHLLQLLALRRVMADGLSGRALYSVLAGQDAAGLARLAQDGAMPELEASQAAQMSGDALSYIQGLRGGQPARSAVAIQRMTAPLPAFLAAQPLGMVQSVAVRRKQREPQSATPQSATTLWRLTPRPGLELTLARDFVVPQSDEDWSLLLTELRRALGELERT